MASIFGQFPANFRFSGALAEVSVEFTPFILPLNLNASLQGGSKSNQYSDSASYDKERLFSNTRKISASDTLKFLFLTLVMKIVSTKRVARINNVTKIGIFSQVDFLMRLKVTAGYIGSRQTGFYRVLRVQ